MQISDEAPIEAAHADPVGAAGLATDLPALDEAVSCCRACPRLVAWRELVARQKRASYAHETYWGRPVPGLGPADAGILVVGLAPAAHGGNRTGRMFTGDRSGDVLFAALHRAGFASQPRSDHPGDGMQLSGLRLTAPVHCAPPDNKPTPSERKTCAPYLVRELELLSTTVRVAIVLGGFGWQALLASLRQGGWPIPVPRPRFGHGVELTLTRPGATALPVDPVGPEPPGSRGPSALTLLGCYHVSQQNTFTGRLTPAMLDAVLERAKEIAARVG